MAAPFRGDVFTHRLLYNPHLHIAPYYLLLVEAAFAPATDEPLLKELPPSPAALAMPVFTPAPEEAASVRTLIEKELGAPLGRPFVLLNPNASDIVPLRKWPQENFELLARRILKEWPEAVIGFTGGRAESARAAELVARLGPKRAVSLAGKTSLRELLVAYTLADLLVTNDSGPGHFSSMVPSMDSLVLFGPETPAIWGPLGPASRTLTAGLACSPCVNPLNHRFSPCQNPRCMQRLTADRVWEEIEPILRRRIQAAPLPVTVVP
jgi:ADP-heptose:LPS heptosyltransferase